MLHLALALQATTTVLPPLTLQDVRLHEGKVPFSRYYPDIAVRTRTSGEAQAICDIAADGALVGCSATASVADMRFDQAALRLLQATRTDKKTQDGVRTKGRQLSVTLVFKIDDDYGYAITLR